MKRILIALTVVAGIVGLLFAGCAYVNMFDQLAYEKPIPSELKLTDITSDIVSAEIVWPNAEPWSYQFVAGLPTNRFAYDQPCPAFDGIVTVTGQDDTLVEQFPVSSTNAQHCNWLIHDHGLDGFILTWRQTNVLRSCSAGIQYKIECHFEKRPKKLTSLWLHYLQSEKQKEK